LPFDLCYLPFDLPVRRRKTNQKAKGKGQMANGKNHLNFAPALRDHLPFDLLVCTAWLPVDVM
jgi:hypothetical protein